MMGWPEEVDCWEPKIVFVHAGVFVIVYFFYVI
jgi:hypothetical protein